MLILAPMSGWGGVSAAFLPRIFPNLPDVTRKSKLMVFGLPATGTDR